MCFNFVMKKQLKILDKAIEIASLLEGNKYKLCAIITDKRNKILSIGVNSFVKTNPLQKKYADRLGEPDKMFIHAEIGAIINLPYGSKPHNIYVARVNRKKSFLAKPCPICQLALKEIGIENIYYTK